MLVYQEYTLLASKCLLNDKKRVALLFFVFFLLVSKLSVLMCDCGVLFKVIFV